MKDKNSWPLFILRCVGGIILYCLFLPAIIYLACFFVVEVGNRIQPLSLIVKIPILLLIGFILKMGREEYLKRQRKLRAGEDEHEE